jgi:Uncharacterized conserved protein
MDFVKPSFEKINEIRRILKNNEYRCSDFCAGTLVLWGDYYGLRYSVIRGYFVLMLEDPLAFSFPIYVGDTESQNNTEQPEIGQKDWENGSTINGIATVLTELMSYFEKHHKKPRFMMMNMDQRKILEELYPGQFEFENKEDYMDYIYTASDLAELKGRRYHGKRNHIYRFEEVHPDYIVEEINEENVSACKALEQRWMEKLYDRDDENLPDNIDDAESSEIIKIRQFEELKYEKEKIEFTLDHMKEMGLFGIAIKTPNNDVIAFCIAERLTADCVLVHFEKADADIQGSYAIINREFAGRMMGKYKYINREEDMGIPGLRKAKQSYHPTFMYEKIMAVEKDIYGV